MYPSPSPDTAEGCVTCIGYAVTAASWQLQLAWSQHGLDSPVVCGQLTTMTALSIVRMLGPADRVHTFTSHKARHAKRQRSKQPLAPQCQISKVVPALELQDTMQLPRTPGFARKRRRSMPRASSHAIRGAAASSCCPTLRGTAQSTSHRHCALALCAPRQCRSRSRW